MIQGVAQAQQSGNREELAQKNDGFPIYKVALAAMTVLGGAAWIYFFSTYQEESYDVSVMQNPAPDAPIVPLEEGALATVQDTASAVVGITSVIFSLLPPMGLMLRLRREEQREILPPQSEVLFQRHSKRSIEAHSSDSAPHTPYTFYSVPKYRSELKQLEQIIGDGIGIELKVFLENPWNDLLKDWSFVDWDHLFITVAHSELKGYVLQFPVCPPPIEPDADLMNCKRMEQNWRKRSFALERLLQEWRGVLTKNARYSQLIVPKCFFFNNLDHQFFAIKEAIEISSEPIGKNPELANAQYVSFVIGVVRSPLIQMLIWGKNVGFVASIKGIRVKDDEPARIAIINLRQDT